MFCLVMGFIDTSLSVLLGNIFGSKEWAAMLLDKASFVSTFYADPNNPADSARWGVCIYNFEFKILHEIKK